MEDTFGLVDTETEEEEIEEEVVEEQPQPIPTIRPRPKSRNVQDKPLIQNVDAVEAKYGGKKSRKSHHQSILSPKESLSGWYMK